MVNYSRVLRFLHLSHKVNVGDYKGTTNANLVNDIQTKIS